MAPGQGTVTVAIKGDASGLRTALGEADTALGRFSDKMRNAGSQISSLGAKMSVGVTLPLVAIGAKAFEMASDLNESINKVNVVFGDSAKAIQDWAQDSAQAFGMSKRQALEAAGTFGNLFRAMGLGQQEAADLSQNLVELASDLASFNNIGTDEALEKLRAGLVGEVEPLRTLGVQLNAATVEAKALELGLVDANGEVTEAGKVQARYALILEQTSTAHGDFARTADGAANKERILKAEFEDTAATIGQKLMPVGMRLLELVGKLATAFSNLSPQMQDVVLISLALAAALGPLTTIVGFLVTALGALAGTAGLVVLGVGAVAGILAYAYLKSEGFRDAVDRLKDAAVDLAQKFYEFLKPILEFIGEHSEELKFAAIALAGVLGGMLLVSFIMLGIAIATVVTGIVLAVAIVLGFIDVLQWLWEKTEGVRGVLGDLAAVARDIVAAAFGSLRDLIARLTDILQALWDKSEGIRSFFADAFRLGLDILRGAVDAVRAAFDALFGSIARVVDIARQAKDILPGIGAGSAADIGRAYLDQQGGSLKIAGSFASGGTVPGPLGSPQLILAHGGETVTPAGGAGGGNTYHVTVNGANMTAEQLVSAIKDYERRNGTGWRN